MYRTRRLLAIAAISAFFVVGVSACGSSDGSDSSADTTATTAKTTGDTTGDTTDDTTADAPDDGGKEGTGTVTLADGEAPADKTITFTADGGFDPATLEVAVGELFTVKQGGDGVNAVKFGDASDTYTISGGLIESFTIDAAGTYTMTEDLTGETATITVTE